MYLSLKKKVNVEMFDTQAVEKEQEDTANSFPGSLPLLVPGKRKATGNEDGE